MFSYYGSKSKVVHFYPAPRYDRIIEPFAGSARYALRWWWKKVLLVDSNEIVVMVWKYLQRATPEEIMALPEPEYKESIENYNLSPEQKALLGFIIVPGSAHPQLTAQLYSRIKQDKKRIARSLDLIRHWEIRLGDYREIENQEATWFIDPPYSKGGEHYRRGNSELNYQELAEWCRSRLGQVIVCEAMGADWLPFTPLASQRGAYSRVTEAVWLSDQVQLQLDW